MSRSDPVASHVIVAPRSFRGGDGHLLILGFEVFNE
jgi:hypothetical protein